MTNQKGTAVITGASSGIGAIVADRLAKRGHDLILVARDEQRLNAVAARISKQTSCSTRVIVADLTKKGDLETVEQILRNDPNITVLVNNAGVGAPALFLDSDINRLVRMVDLNVTALVRLSYAVLPTFLNRNGGAIVNV